MPKEFKQLRFAGFWLGTLCAAALQIASHLFASATAAEQRHGQLYSTRSERRPLVRQVASGADRKHIAANPDTQAESRVVHRHWQHPNAQAVAALRKETSLAFPEDVVGYDNPSCAPAYTSVRSDHDTRLASVIASTCHTPTQLREVASGAEGKKIIATLQKNCSHFNEPCCLRAGLLVYAMVTQLMREEGLQWFAWCGTLLGAVRHGGVIPHDHDLDLGVFVQSVEDEQRIERVVQRASDMGMTPWNRLFVTHYGFPDSGAMHLDVFKFVTLAGFPLISNERGNRSLPVQDNGIPTGVQSEFVGIPFDERAAGHDGPGHILHRHQLLPLRNCSFHGTRIPCPHEYVKVLTGLYGHNLNSPEEEHEHVRIAQDCLANHGLPNIVLELRHSDASQLGRPPPRPMNTFCSHDSAGILLIATCVLGGFAYWWCKPFIAREAAATTRK